MKTPEQLADEYGALPVRAECCAECRRIGFLIGYQEAMPKWISVKERLPELDDWVIGYYGMWYQKDQMFVGPVKRKEHPRTKETYWHNEQATNDGGYEEVEIVTHWMPLPEPPKEEK